MVVVKKAKPSKQLKKSSFPHLVNEKIPFVEVLLLDNSGQGKNLVVSLKGALEQARQQGLDLVCLRLPKGKELAVCKIVDYQKYLFAAKKSKKNQPKKASQLSVLKKIRLTFQIGEKDLITKAQQIKKWLENGYSVKVSLKMFGRETEHQDLVLAKCQQLITSLQAENEKINLARNIKLQGKVYSFLLQKNK